MSDPMTNAEVEDVLSSIRRLVSDEKPILGSAPQPKANDRLVLTPSLRVTEEPEDSRDDALSETEPQEESRAADHDDLADDQNSADVLAAVQEATEDQWADDASDESDAPDRPDDVSNETPAPEQDTDEADGYADHDEVAAFVFEHVRPDQLEVDEDHSSPEVAQRDAHDATEEVVEHDAPVEPAPDAEHADRSLGEKIAALETLIASRKDVWEPDGTGTDAYAGTEAPTLEWEDTDAAPAAASPSSQAEFKHNGVAADADQQLFSSDEDVLDEEALRDLVSDIVREELQGALGERITRNVRKLVRREIHRALAAQELE